MKHTYEVEIKSLLGSEDNVSRLKTNLQKTFGAIELTKKGSQLNHYFNTPTDLSLLKKNLAPVIAEEKKATFDHILTDGKKISIRTRDADGTVIFVVKASVGDDTSSNGVKRIEFESVVNKTLGELDQILLDSGCSYQAKWSRKREEYKAGDINICIDKNAGYGYVAEFEKVTPEESLLEETRQQLLATMKELGVEELPQDRLERMFAHYNSHWAEYYGTEKTFVIN